MLEAVWRSREDGLIKFADLGSRDFHVDDIILDFESMIRLFKEFNSFDIDTFASASNTKAGRLFSKLDVMSSSGMDFFHQRWEK